MQNGTHVPKTRPALILLLAVILAAVAALSLHTGSAIHAQTATGANRIKLRWNAVTDAAGYRLGPAAAAGF